MNVYGISDLHLDSRNEKPMDVFGEHWKNHAEKIFTAWKETVKPEDIVLIPGDISWANSLKDAQKDLELINMLPGKKIISKGNHDYWWSSMTKLRNLNMESLLFLHNNSYTIGDYEVFGARGWSIEEETLTPENNEKIFKREILRLKNSIASMKNTAAVKIALLHFPPFNRNMDLNELGEIIISEGADYCVYGHIHGADREKSIFRNRIENTIFKCVSADYIDFMPEKIIQEKK